MKRIILFLIILILSLFLAACKSEYDMKCDACGGEYHYKTTVNFWDNTFYYYRCQNCGKEFRTEIWRGK